MLRYLYALMTLLISLAGCAPYHAVRQERLETLPHHYARFGAVLAWEIIDAGPEMVIEGEFKNAGNVAIEDVEIWVEALDRSGKTMARSAGFVIPYLLTSSEIAPFTVKLPVQTVPGTELRFTYKYSGIGADGGVGDWMQIFYALVPDLQ